MRREGLAKIRGETKYIDDQSWPHQVIFGMAIRSPVARGTLTAIEFDQQIDWSDFCIVTPQDIPGKNRIKMIEDDWPYLAEDQINHYGEPILLLAHPDRQQLQRGAAHITLQIDPLPPVLTIEESLSEQEIIWQKGNTFKSYQIKRGTTESIFSSGDYQIFEQEYRTGAQEQLYLEPNGVVATFDPELGVTIYGSLQCPYYVDGAMATLLNLEKDKVRIVQSPTGGGFGGKEDYPSILAGHAALLALHSKQAVKMIYDRKEDMAVTTKRHPSRTKIKSAHDKDGKIAAIQIEFILDGGAYATLSEVVLSRGALHCFGPYFCQHVQIDAKAVATNHPPNGAFRGFGAPQSIFAMERHLDLVAAKLKLTPEEVRRVNFITKGQSSCFGQTFRERVDYHALMDIVFEQSDFHNKQQAFQKYNADPSNPVKKGIGFATFLHGSGFTGSGEDYLASRCTITARQDGKVEVLASSTEIGQGKDTIFTQIVAQELKLPHHQVVIAPVDTSIVPDSGPTVASRTTMIVGNLVKQAAAKLRDQLIETKFLASNYQPTQVAGAIKNYLAQHDTLTINTQYQRPEGVAWDDQSYSGDAYATYAWAVYLAEVEVDTLTYQTRVTNFYALQEVGKVVNQILAQGQIEGGVVQGIGHALYEHVLHQDGRMINNHLTDYIIPTSIDTPPIKVIFEEWNRQYGPDGAKGIGELPMDGPAPAVINAVVNAVGSQVYAIPMLPENLMEAMQS
ncbi:MAG: xanthine dehydrogenase family protein [Bdellovibrionales bacterium]|nr:xanthine dehydrogenase family protein [Bdellovibrionales bacterium]MBT3525738.1 xanthine dehydrogenase family protein [Bdellovibrionales bacterium]MBT7669661.1 xanthine dehydrogenase family protein [Bdellovibrionales bacterium]